MSKINLDTFKKLLSVKSGGAEFFRFIVKSIFWIFIIGSVFYGLIFVPNQQLNMDVAKTNIEITKVQRQCEGTIRNNLAAAMEQAKKDEKEVSKEEQETYLNNGFAQCMYLNGFNLPKEAEEKTSE